MKNREKQIKEMAKMLSEDCGSCENYKALGATADGVDCTDYYYARKLYNAGYRKSTDLAEEIFAEIKELLNLQAKIVCKMRGKYRETDKPRLSFIAELDGRLYSLRVVEEQLAELKKKYTGGK